MSLLQFHIVLISAAILLSAGLGFWGLNQYGISHGLEFVFVAGSSFLLGMLLAGYLVWFITKKLPRFKS